MPNSILIVDDEKHMCISLSKLFNLHGFKASYETDARSALATLRKQHFDLVITDLKMPGMDGISFIDTVKSMKLPVPIIMISGYASIENVVEAMRCGAVNFYSKPVNTGALLEEIRKLLSIKKNSQQEELDIITANSKINELILMAGKAGPTDAPVIITGESGTGKELFAAHIHNMSKRKDKPYVKINCAAIPENLLESELFGHVKGAFTDAREDRMGKFAAAEGGTIFFDEIGEMSMKTQVKLLRVIQEKEYEQVGSDKIRHMDIRFIAATNKNLPELIERGQFREDLYYRLNVVSIDIPPLRERKDDVLPLARHFLNEMNLLYNRQIVDLTDEAASAFLKHDWPGNVRELKNTIERAVIFCEEEKLGIEALPETYRNRIEYESGHLKNVYDKVTREVILEALEKTNGSKQKAAELLNINRRTLYNKMKLLDLL
ncbi:MAG: sigma-54-dependent transcriptional regulator [Sediminispirochaetaceae bacterium]